MRLREADRIIHLYTATHGRVGAVVKGVRRTKSRFGGRLEPFFRVRLVLYEGRGELDTVTQAEAIEWYPRLRESRRLAARRGRGLRVGAAAVRRGRGNAAAYNLLCHELQLLDADPTAAGPANLLAFRLKLLLAAGFVPGARGLRALRRGARGRARRLSFSAAAGGVTCAGCGPAARASRSTAPRSPSWPTALGSAAARRAGGARRPTLGQVDRAVTGTLEYHAHVRLRSVA